MVRLVAVAEVSCRREMKMTIDQQVNGKHGDSMLPAQLAGQRQSLITRGRTVSKHISPTSRQVRYYEETRTRGEPICISRDRGSRVIPPSQRPMANGNARYNPPRSPSEVLVFAWDPTLSVAWVAGGSDPRHWFDQGGVEGVIECNRSTGRSRFMLRGVEGRRRAAIGRAGIGLTLATVR